MGAAAEPEVQAALVAHDRIWKTTDIPLFFDNRAKETVTPQQLIERLEMAGTVAYSANDERKCAEFFLCLREVAFSWFNTLDLIIGFNKKVLAERKGNSWLPTHPSSQPEHCVSFSRPSLEARLDNPGVLQQGLWHVHQCIQDQAQPHYHLQRRLHG
jgi:hypothetical protein